MRRAIALSSIALSAFLLSNVTPLAAHQSGVAGTWKLNEAESNNPNGPAPGAAKPPQKPKGGEKDMTGGASKSSAPQAASELSPEEKTRIAKMLGLMNKAAGTLDIALDGGDCVIKQDGSGFPKQNCDFRRHRGRRRHRRR